MKYIINIGVHCMGYTRFTEITPTFEGVTARAVEGMQ